MAYEAIVSKIKTAPHPNANKIQLGYCFGFQVIIGLEVKDGDFGIFFPEGGVLGDNFCRQNNLYPIFDEEGNRVGGGFFSEKNPRVKAQNFRGQKSQGFWIPLSSLDYLNPGNLEEGFQFTHIEGEEICHKYINQATLRAIKNKDKKDKKTKVSVKETPMFPMHTDTKQLKYFVDKLPIGATVYITSKLHGTSGRTANAPNPFREFGWKDKLKLIWSVVRKGDFSSLSQYKILTGSRRVIKDFKEGARGFYEKDDFRFEATQDLAPFIKKGETVFYEIVGYAHGDTPLMPSVDNKAVGRKEFTKKFGPETHWTYGCAPGQSKVYIYNWIISNEDGYHYSYPWEKIQKMAQVYGLKTVPLLGTFEIIERGNQYSLEELIQFSQEQPGLPLEVSREELAKVVEVLTEDQFETAISGANHLREGVCLRVEKDGELVDIYKNKAHSFAILEGYISSDTVDIEVTESY